MTPIHNKTLTKLWLGLLIYFAINAFSQLLVTNTADLDQSEQILLSQSLHLGYNTQPPLYTYIVNGLYQLFGVGLPALAVLKTLLLASTAGGILLIAKQLRFSTMQTLVCICGLLLIPQYIWESQRDLTHSVLCTSMACLTLLQIFYLKEKQNLTSYALLGLFIACGFLSKYTFAIFVCAIILAILANKDFRHILLNSRSIIAYVVFAVLVAPHLLWIVDNFATSSGSLDKLESSEISGLASTAKGLASAILAAVAFLSPLWLFGLLFLFKQDKQDNLTNSHEVKQIISFQKVHIHFLIQIALFVMLLIAAIVIVFHAQKIKDRWYQPLLFFVPIIVAYFAGFAKSWTHKTFIGISAALSLLVAIFLPLRTLLADTLNTDSRPNMPYPELIAEISTTLTKKQGNIDFVLAESKLLGGNARLVLPNTPIRIKEYRSNPIKLSGTGILLCKSKNCEHEELTDWLKNCNIDAGNPQQITKNYHYSNKKQLRIDWQVVRVENCLI